MAFTTQIFTFVFMPITFILYYPLWFLQKRWAFLQKFRATDILLILFSLAFYSWTCFDDAFLLLAYIVLVYLFGTLIKHFRHKGLYIQLYNKQGGGGSLSVALIFTLACCALVAITLVHFKCMPIIAPVLEFLFKTPVTASSIIAPLGISFIAFSAISYLADVYNGKADAGNFIDFLLYISLFSKVVSGPIVLWRDYKNQTADISFNRFIDGMTRVMIGFSKKLILADVFGACIASINNTNADAFTVFGSALLYMLQIYYDFSGYSDIAIGLSKMFGFDFEENFNFPYISTSITEFWRRWHISLGRWFREYVYFPLGGSRRGQRATILNIAIVFLLTGIWHGAGWTYILWGAINGICNIIEKLIGTKKLYIKTPKIIKWFFTMFVTFFCWELFRAPDISYALNSIAIMFGIKQPGAFNYTWQYYFDTRIIVLTIIGIIGATVFGIPWVQKIYKKFEETAIGYIITRIFIFAMFVISVLFMVNSTYSPFIYFQY